MTHEIPGLGRVLQSIPVKAWKTKRAVVLDWYDGPREGLCELAQPSCGFYFKMFGAAADIHQPGNLFRISEIDLDLFRAVDAHLQAWQESTTNVWVPIWTFTDHHQRMTIEMGITNLIKTSRPTNLIICTNDMRLFKGFWYHIDIG